MKKIVSATLTLSILAASCAVMPFYAGAEQGSAKATDLLAAKNEVYGDGSFENTGLNAGDTYLVQTAEADGTLSGKVTAAQLQNTLQSFAGDNSTYGAWIPVAGDSVATDQKYVIANWAAPSLAENDNKSDLNQSNYCLAFPTNNQHQARRVDGLVNGATYTIRFLCKTSKVLASTNFFCNFSDTDRGYNEIVPAYNIQSKASLIDLSDLTTEWQEKTLTFTYTGPSTNYFHFLWNATEGGHKVYIDDFSITAVADGMVKFSGNAMRTTGNQALRFKFYVPNTFKAENGYTVNNQEVSELGFLVQYNAVLGGKELVLGGKYTYNGKEFGVNSGIGYQKDGVNKVFEAKDGKTYYSAALTNIGVKSDNSVNYSYYEQDLCVRPYVKLANGTVLYGETQKSSVFATMQYILDESHSEVSAADREAVQALLNSDESLKTAYDAWNKE